MGIRFFEPLFITFGYIFITIVLYCESLWQSFNRDDFFWISGLNVGDPLRLTQHLIQHIICLPLFGENPFPYHLLSITLHFVNSLLVYFLFILMFKVIKSTINNSYSSLHIGGVVAGFFFLVYNSGAPAWIAAFSYQIGVFFILVTLLCSLQYFKTRRIIFWVAAGLAYGFALGSHCYAMGLLGFIGFLEIIWGKASATQSKDLIFMRYLFLALILSIFIWGFWNKIIITGFDKFGEQSIQSVLFQIPKYLLYVIYYFGFPRHLPQGTAIGLTHHITLLIILGLCIFGIFRILKRDKKPGISEFLVLFFILWNGLAFLQTASIGFIYCKYRYYFNAVGFSIATAYGMVEIIGFISRRTRWISSNILLVLLVIGLPTIFLMKSEQFELKRPVTCNKNQYCSELEILDLDQVERIIETNRNFVNKNLFCKNIKFLNLSMLDLSGTNMSGSDFSGAVLREVNMEKAVFWGADLTGAVFEDSNLRGAAFEYANLEGAVLRRCNLDYAYFGGAKLKGATLEGASLVEAEFWIADLEMADLTDTNLDGAVFWRTELMDTLLDRAYLKDVNLAEAKGLTCDQIATAIIDQNTKLPDYLSCDFTIGLEK